MGSPRGHPAPAPSGSGPPPRSITWFCARFSALALGLFLLVFVLDERGAAPLSRVIASVVAHGLSAVGIPAERAGTLLTVGGFRGAVIGQCTGLFEAALLVAAIWAWPASLHRRVRGTLMGVAFLFLVNLVRVTSLMLIGAHAPQWFRTAHLYVWQALLIAVVGATWLVWARRAPATN